MISSVIFPAGTNFQAISAALTAVQKCAFVMYVSACLLNGTIFNFFNKYLTPERQAFYWVDLSKFFNSYLGYEPAAECRNFRDMCLNHRCIDSLLLIEDADILDAISHMPPSYRSFYLTVVRGSKVLAPYLLQASLLFATVIGGVLPFLFIKRTLQAFDVNSAWARIPLKETFFSGRTSVAGLNLLAVIPGFLITSGITCHLTTQNSTKVCDSPSCLYCITSLSKTIFRDFYQSGSVISSGEKTKLILTVAVYISSAILTLILYYCTIIFVCLGIYITLDAVSSVWATGVTLAGSISRTSPTNFQDTLNKLKPNFRDLCYRWMQRNQIRDQIQQARDDR